MQLGVVLIAVSGVVRDEFESCIKVLLVIVYPSICECMGVPGAGAAEFTEKRAFNFFEFVS